MNTTRGAMTLLSAAILLAPCFTHADGEAICTRELAGESARAAAIMKKATARSERVEAKRQEQFQKDQKSLEKELGL